MQTFVPGRLSPASTSLMVGPLGPPDLGVDIAFLRLLLPSQLLRPQTEVMTKAPQQIQVAVCEDNDALRGILTSVLPEFGIRVFGVSSAEALDRLLVEREVDLVILDIGLPGEDGFSASARLLHERPHLGIVMLTARTLVADRVQGLNQGADLYFTKPVDMEELAASLFSLQRRLGRNVVQPVRPWELHQSQFSLEAPTGVVVELTANEVLLLARLMEVPGTRVDREELYRALDWPSDDNTENRMGTLISRLRSKVSQAIPAFPFPLRTLHGFGYMFKTDQVPKP